MNLIAIFLALLAGSSIVVSRMVNAQLATHTTMHQSTFYNFMTGFASSLFILIAAAYVSPNPAHFISPIPRWAYCGGILGLIVVSISNVITPKLSALVLTLLIFTGQIVSGIGIDFFSTHHLSTLDLLGTSLVIIGLYVHLKLSHQ